MIEYVGLFQQGDETIQARKEAIIMSKVLMTFYSRKGQNYVSGSIKNLPVGNTEVMEHVILNNGVKYFCLSVSTEYIMIDGN